MEHEEHKIRHQQLHNELDELVADMVMTTKMLPGSTTVLELMQWSYQQALDTTEESK